MIQSILPSRCFANKLAAAISLLLIFIYFWIIVVHIVNLPFYDDYDVVFGFLRQYLAVDTTAEKLALLLSQDNEHRFLSHRLVILADYYLFGEVDLRHIMLFGSIFTIGLWYFLLRVSKLDWIQFLPVTLLFFVPIDRIVAWQATAFIQPFLLLTVFLSLYLLDRQDRLGFWGALFFSFVATFTFGHGLFVFLSGTLLLLLKRPFSWERLFFWNFMFVLCLFIYFYEYSTPAHRSGLFAQLFQNILVVLAYPNVLLGSFFKSFYGQHIVAAPIIGSLLLLCTAGIVYYKWNYFRKHPFWLACLFFLLFTIGILALTRSGFGIGQATTRRYKLLTVSYLSIVYIVIFTLWKQKCELYLKPLLLLCLFFYYFRIEDNTDYLAEHRQKLIHSHYFFQTGNINYLLHYSPSSAAKSLRDAIAARHFRMPDLQTFLNVKTRKIPILAPDIFIKTHWEIFVDNNYFIQAKGWAFRSDTHTTFLSIYLVLKSDQNGLMYLAKPVARPDLSRTFVSNYRLDNAGFELLLDKRNIDLPSGMYQVGLFLDYGSLGENTLIYSDYIVNLQSKTAAPW